MFGVLATGFSVLLGFIIFLAFQSYDQARSGAETEAVTVAQQVQTAQFLPADVREELTRPARLLRPGRGRRRVAADAGRHAGRRVQPVGSGSCSRPSGPSTPQTDVEQSAYDRWMDQTSDREQARIDRVHGAEGLIPLPLWLVLYVISAVIFVYVLFFADSAEGAVTQGLLMGSVTVVITLLLLLLGFFDHPHGDEMGKLEPVAMERDRAHHGRGAGGGRPRRDAAVRRRRPGRLT